MKKIIINLSSQKKINQKMQLNPAPSFFIYNASAGSGKTYTIVVKYLGILLLSPKKDTYKNILAITFTNKAVAEMKTRIITALKNLSEEETEATQNLFDSVVEETGLSKTSIRQRSKSILLEILHNYAALEINTIDGFTHRLIRTFAKELKISSAFGVELDTPYILQKAVDQVLDQLGTEKNITKAVVDFAMRKVDDDKSWNLGRDLTKFGQILFNDNHLEAISRLEKYELEDFSVYTKELQQKISALEQKAIDIAEGFFELLNENNLEDGDFTRKTIPNYFHKIIDRGDWFPSQSQWQTNIEEASFYNKTLDEVKKETIETLRPKIATTYRAIEQIAYRKKLYEDVLRNVSQLSLLNAIEKEIENIKAEEDLLLISDFNKTIYEAIKDLYAPFIYERLGEKFNYFFIDEFQDTSVLQWENILPLLDYSLTNSLQIQPQGKLFTVGDVKQAIYRWRGGKPEQFLELTEGKNPFQVKEEVLSLEDNWRSYQNIIDFNNDFFKFLTPVFGKEAYQKLYQKASQHKKKQEKGYVAINFVEASKKEERLQLYADKCLEILKDLQAKNYILGEVCILVRKKDIGVFISNYLAENGFEINSSETLLLKNSKEVNFIINILYSILNPKDNHFKFALLYYLYQHLKIEEDVYTFVFEKLKYAEQDFFRQLIPYHIYFDLHQFSQFSFYESVEYLIRSFNLPKEASAHLIFFLDFVYEFSQKEKASLLTFLKKWEQKKDKLSLKNSQNRNAVNVMTIHQSKGLEFDTIILPLEEDKFTDTSKDHLWINLPENFSVNLGYINVSQSTPLLSENIALQYEELLHEKQLDIINLYYVAATRAKKNLFILPQKVKNEKNSVNGYLQTFLSQQKNWDGESLFEMGNMLENQTKKSQPEATTPIYFESVSPQQHQINIITKSGLLWDTPQETSIHFGLLQHETLKHIHYVGDIFTSVEKLTAEGLILEEEKELYVREIEKIVLHPELKKYYEKPYEIRNEVEVLHQKEFIRLDRLCLHKNKAVIIDYKTGSPKEKDEIQLKNYAEAIENMGYQVEQKILIYIKHDAPIKIVYF
ncbi:exodeoxyribonuclease V subunit beta [Mesonia sp. K7]|uniref:UvrD-helicase domain-containing protein n=1 Tax=Mesonia sp. K7 TaxID=2218606 RepID=UPI000DA7886F|nr:UvrD-helicase domain-containing protein [Mesonia sp. K7]PZD79068.1 DNA helicase UvrD [Mesonia sp. K7]